MMGSQGTIWAELGIDLTKLDQGLRNAESKLKAAEKNLEGFEKAGERLIKMGTKLSLGVTAPIAAMGVAAIKASVDLESAFAGVRKTVDATEAELQALQEGFEDMARRIPLATSELYGIGEAAGQLGIRTENILGFTEVMAKLGATTNLSSDQAATSLARLANITQMPQTEFERLGSTIVALGNNLATTEAEIVQMGLRLAGAGKQIGLTEAQIMSMAGALSSVGIEADAGGSAVSRVMVEIANAVASGGESLSLFASVAGMSVNDFRRAFQEDAAGAIITFIEGLGRVSDSGQNTFAVLDELGLSEIRVRDALLRASNAGDLFRQSMALGNQAWSENAALTKEAEVRFETTAAQFQLFKNDVHLLAKEFGDQLTPVLRTLLDKYVRPAIQWFTDLDDSTKKFLLTVAGAAAVVGPTLLVFGGLAKTIVDIHSAGALLGPVINGLAVKFGLKAAAASAAATGTAAVGTASAVATPAVAGLGAAVNFLLGPWGLLIAGVVGLVALLSKLGGTVETSAQKMERLEREAWIAAGTMEGDLSPAMLDVGKAANEGAEGIRRFYTAEEIADQKASLLAEGAGRLAVSVESTARTVKACARDAEESFASLQERVSEETGKMDSQLEIVRARFDLLSASLDPVSDASTLLTEKMAAQRDEMALIAEKIETLKSSYEQMKALKGANAEESLRLEASILKEQKAYADLQKEIAAANEELRKQAAYKAGRPWEAEGRSATKQELQDYADQRAVEMQYESGGKIVGGAGDLMDALKKKTPNYEANVKAIAEAANVDMGVAEAMMKSHLLQKYRDGLIKLAMGGIIHKPVLISDLVSGRPVGIAGEAGEEVISPLGRGGLPASTQIIVTGNHIASDYDVDRIGEQLVRRLRLAGVKL